LPTVFGIAVTVLPGGCVNVPLTVNAAVPLISPATLASCSTVKGAKNDTSPLQASWPLTSLWPLSVIPPLLTKSEPPISTDAAMSSRPLNPAAPPVPGCFAS
jgi:hypothetical protein